MKRTSLLSRTTLLTATAALAPTLAHAHPSASHDSGLVAGFVHPLLGMDHMIAMVAVGLWAVQRGGRGLWQIPATFVGAMALGSAMAMMGARIPLVESGILASGLVLGVLIAMAARLPAWAGTAMIFLFALFHGSAHGSEMPAGSDLAAYTAGFVLATAALHAVGVAAGLGLRNAADAQWLRASGVAVAVATLLVTLGIL